MLVLGVDRTGPRGPAVPAACYTRDSLTAAASALIDAFVDYLIDSGALDDMFSGSNSYLGGGNSARGQPPFQQQQQQQYGGQQYGQPQQQQQPGYGQQPLQQQYTGYAGQNTLDITHSTRYPCMHKKTDSDLCLL